MSNTVDKINDKFTQRLTRSDREVGRPVNPFATTSAQDKQSSFFEALLKPEISSMKTVGAIYRERVIDTKVDDTLKFDGYHVFTNPKAGHLLHSTGRLELEHTREK